MGRTRGRSTGKFVYKKRTEKQLQHRASQSTGYGDSFLKGDFSLFKPKEGPNRFRILPPMWEDPEHWGLDIFVHYSIGPDNGAYLCLDRMKKGDCPICEERLEAEKQGDEEYSSELRPVRRVLVWLIKRGEEEAGPVLWAGPQKLDGDLFKLSTASSDGTLFIDDPEEGYDVEFTYTPPKNKKPGNYEALQISRRSTPLGTEKQMEEWLEFVSTNILPDVLVYFEANYIRNIFSGKPHKSEKAAEKQETEQEKKEEPTTRRGRSKPAVEYTFEEVQKMSGSELDDVCEKLGIEINNDMTDQDVADKICSVVGLEAPKEEEKSEPPAGKRESYQERIARLRDKG